MRSGWAWVHGLWVVLVGCGGPIEPISGEWAYDNEIIVENTCGPAIDYTPVEGSFTLDNNGDGTFIVDPRDGGEPFECTLDGRRFDCPERRREVIELTAGATAEVSGSVTGRFEADDDADGSQTAVLTCLDAGCQSLASLAGISDPCTITVEFAATLSE